MLAMPEESGEKPKRRYYSGKLMSSTDPQVREFIQEMAAHGRITVNGLIHKLMAAGMSRTDIIRALETVVPTIPNPAGRLSIFMSYRRDDPMVQEFKAKYGGRRRKTTMVHAEDVMPPEPWTELTPATPAVDE